MAEIDQLASECLKEATSTSSQEKSRRLEDILGNFTKCEVYGDEKMALAAQAYEVVDRHIRKLDLDMAAIEAHLAARKESDDDSDKQNGNKKTLKTDAKKQKGKKDKDVTTSDVDDAETPFDAVDMPVDPNEPTYCSCHQVAYGEMIGCDRPDCQIEWFHFGCVGLQSKPKGKWFCPKCSKNRRKK
jgi:hypothetical protein